MKEKYNNNPLYPYDWKRNGLSGIQLILGNGIILPLPATLIGTLVFGIWWATSQTWQAWSFSGNSAFYAYIGIGIGTMIATAYARGYTKFTNYWSFFRGFCSKNTMLSQELCNMIVPDNLPKISYLGDFHYISKALPYIVVWSLRGKVRLNKLPIPKSVQDVLSSSSAQEEKPSDKRHNAITLSNDHFSTRSYEIAVGILRKRLSQMENTGVLTPNQALLLRGYLKDMEYDYGTIGNNRYIEFPRQLLAIFYFSVVVYFALLSPVLLTAYPLATAYVFYALSVHLAFGIIMGSRVVEDPLLKPDTSMFSATTPISSVSDACARAIDYEFFKKYKQLSYGMDKTTGDVVKLDSLH